MLLEVKELYKMALKLKEGCKKNGKGDRLRIHNSVLSELLVCECRNDINLVIDSEIAGGPQAR